MTIAKSRVISTKRLRIEPFTAKDITSTYVAWLNDPEVIRFSEQRHCHHTLDSCRKYLASFEGTPHYFWALRMTSNDQHIGNMNAYVDERNHVADVGILVGARVARGQGYGTEAWRAICRHLLTEQGMRKVTAGTLSVNYGMLAIMRKTGMKQDGVRRKQCLIDGQEVDLVHAAIFLDEHEAGEGVFADCTTGEEVDFHE